MQPRKKKKEMMEPLAQALLFQVLANLKLTTKKPGRKLARRRSGL